MPVIIKKKFGTVEEFTPKSAPEKFKCMLAASEIPTEDELVFPLLASVKLDGIRSPILNGVAMSRKMLPLPNQSIQAWVAEYSTFLQGLDGEMIVGPPNLPTTFNTTTSGVMKVSGKPDFKFYVFEHWGMGLCNAKDRADFLAQYLKAAPAFLTDRIVLIPQRWVHNVEELRNFYAQALHEGYEGLILKSPYKPYKFGRSTIKEGAALKFKEFIDYNCVILEVKQGKTNTNEKVKDELGHAKRSTAKAGKVPNQEVGGFVVECTEKESVYYGMQFNCGPGSLTQAELRALWGSRENIVGRTIRVKSQKLGGKSLPRFPSFFGWRSAIDMGDAE